MERETGGVVQVGGREVTLRGVEVCGRGRKVQVYVVFYGSRRYIYPVASK